MTSQLVTHKITPYKVKDSGKRTDQVLQEINATVYVAHGPDIKGRSGAIGMVVDPLFQYERFLIDLDSIKKIECRPYRELFTDTCPPEKIWCGIRHDVDIDIRAAITQAQMESRHGIRSTYFILHTAPYYGVFIDGIFHRNDSMIEVYKYIQSLGHEIALHTDPLLVYQDQKMDGAQAVVDEIDWLRASGIDIVGTTAHNSMGAYGAANYAIFKGRPQGLFLKPEDCPKEAVLNGKWAPLWVLDETEMGLEYEANEAFWQDRSPVSYGVTWGVNKWWWEDEKSCHFLQKPTEEKRYAGFIDYEQLVENLSNLEGGSLSVLVVHPVYYGARHSIDSGPVMSMDRESIQINADVGWNTYAPFTIKAKSGFVDEVQEFQSINMSNDWGMLSFPLCSKKEDALNIGIFGAANIQGATLGIDAHVSKKLSEHLESSLKKEVNCWTFAHENMGFTRYISWYEKVKDDLSLDIIILGVGADEILRSHADFWSVHEGVNFEHAPGDYLHWDGRSVQRVTRSKGADIRLRKGQGDIDFPLLGSNVAAKYDQYVQECLKWFISSLQQDGRKVILLLDECGERKGLWGPESDAAAREHCYLDAVNWLKKLQQELDVPLVNPYAVFFQQDSVSAHWQSACEWNYIAHRIAGKVLADSIIDGNFFDHA